MTERWKKWTSVIVAFCAIGGFGLGIWNTILSPMFEEQSNIHINNVNITRFPEENFPEQIDEEWVYISIFNPGNVDAENVIVDIVIDIPYYDYNIVAKEDYTIEWGGETHRNTLGLHFPRLIGEHGIGITLYLKNQFLINNSVEPTVRIYEEGHMVDSYYAPVLTV